MIYGVLQLPASLSFTNDSSGGMVIVFSCVPLNTQIGLVEHKWATKQKDMNVGRDFYKNQELEEYEEDKRE